MAVLQTPQISNPCRIQPSSPQKRSVSEKTFIRENAHIASAIRRMMEAQPNITMQVERINLVGCTGLLPYQLENMISNSIVRIKVLTHVDTLSEEALRHQLAYVEEQEKMKFPASKNKYPTAIIAVNLTVVDKQKDLRLLQEAIFGASQLASNNQVWVCGSPNSGKSSLILPLTKQRTITVRNKKSYHLPKISQRAGMTLGIKKHVMESSDAAMFHTECTLHDMPGIRPRMDDPRTPVALMFAARVSETFPNYHEVCHNDLILQLQLESCNRHELLTYQYGEYMKEVPHPIPSGGPSTGIAEPLRPMPLPYDETNPLQHIRPDYVGLFNLKGGATNDPRVLRTAAQKVIPSCTDKKIMTKFHHFDCGGMVFTPTHKYHHILKNFACSMKFHYGSPIIYMNDAAVRLVDIHHGRAFDFEPNGTDRFSDDEEDDPNDPRYDKKEPGKKSKNQYSGINWENVKNNRENQYPDINWEDVKNYRMK